MVKVRKLKDVGVRILNSPVVSLPLMVTFEPPTIEIFPELSLMVKGDVKTMVPGRTLQKLIMSSPGRVAA